MENVLSSTFRVPSAISCLAYLSTTPLDPLMPTSTLSWYAVSGTASAAVVSMPLSFRASFRRALVAESIPGSTTVFALSRRIRLPSPYSVFCDWG